MSPIYKLRFVCFAILPPLVLIVLVHCFGTYLDGVETIIIRMANGVIAHIPQYLRFDESDNFLIYTYPPLYIASLASLSSLLGVETSLMARAISFASFVGILGIAAQSFQFRDKTATLLLLLFSGFIMLRWAIAIRPDMLALFFLVLYVALVFISNKNAHIYLSGIFPALALAIKPNMLGIVFGMVVLFFIKKDDRLKRFKSLLSIGLFTALFYAFYEIYYGNIFYSILNGGQGSAAFAHGIRISLLSLGSLTPLFLFLIIFRSYRDCQINLVWTVLSASTLFWGLLTSIKGGSDTNYFLEFNAVLIFFILFHFSQNSLSPKRLWPVLVLNVFIAIWPWLSEMQTLHHRKQSEHNLNVLLSDITQHDPDYFKKQGYLVNLPLDVGQAYPPHRMDYYTGLLHKIGTLDMSPLFENLCTGNPAILVSLYDLSDKQTVKTKNYLLPQWEETISQCLPFQYKCGEHYVFMSVDIAHPGTYACTAKKKIQVE